MKKIDKIKRRTIILFIGALISFLILAITSWIKLEIFAYIAFILLVSFFFGIFINMFSFPIMTLEEEIEYHEKELLRLKIKKIKKEKMEDN